ncbi:3-oxoacyl-[acyl-carrier-protein] synthase III C-terminal domain-containing protein [Streptomyces sp. NPDC002785]|uniref:3-oxoacyl-ACP synthase III family protein n=1 Tax=Streptomyces sp. NPDC002785 TaxID=3154543 RepID=UPI003327F512
MRTITTCDSFPVLGDGEREWELALRAAQEVMKRTQVPPSAVRTVIYAGTGEWDIPCWSPSAKVAHELGIRQAYCFELTNHCNAVTAAVQIGCDRVAARDGEYTLVLIGDRVSTLLDYSDPHAKEMFNQGDAGAAFLLSASGSTVEVLQSKMCTDPSWCDYYTGVREGERVVIRRNGDRDGLADAYAENFVGLTTDVLASLGKDITDVAYLLVTHGSRPIHERLLLELGLPETRSVFNYHRLGHMGGADTFIAMQDLITAKKLRRGDLVLHATSAVGFSWGVMAMEYAG